MERKRGNILKFVLYNILLTSVGAIEKNVTEEVCKRIAKQCKPGVFIPLWTPVTALSGWDIAGRAIVYFLLLIFFFVGVSIIADRFMTAIEVITSKERQVTIKLPDGTDKKIKVRVWNETVSNLTLMALGSSAPEILLSIIEIMGNGYELGDIGPGTIVGSAAFNLFFIIGYCIMIIPKGETRRLKHVNVFLLTAVWSIFAYLWMYIMIAVISPNVIEIWEAILTLIFFPLTVISAYMVDRRLCERVFTPKYIFTSKNNDNKLVGVPHKDKVDSDKNSKKSIVHNILNRKIVDSDAMDRPTSAVPTSSASVENINESEYNNFNQEYIQIVKDIKEKNPHITNDELQIQAEIFIMDQGPKSRAYYRIQATRSMTAGGKLISRNRKLSRTREDVNKMATVQKTSLLDSIQHVHVEMNHYTVMENAGHVEIKIQRHGGDLSKKATVHYETKDDSAVNGDDYIAVEGNLTFYPNEIEKSVQVKIVDDDIFEENEQFFFIISDPKMENIHGVIEQNSHFICKEGVATVLILDDDHGGFFEFKTEQMDVYESKGMIEVPICRKSGARGRVGVFIKTHDGTSKGGGIDYDDFDKEIVFEDNEYEKKLYLKIYDHGLYERNVSFVVEMYKIENYEQEKFIQDEKARLVHEKGRPMLGKMTSITVHIREDTDLKNTIDNIVKNSNISSTFSQSWKEQFVEAITVETDDEERPKFFDYFTHVISVFWKVLFALVPPTNILGGWACFTVSIIVIGVLTGFIGDFASSFGCTLGIKGSVVAITFVALGTSLPDMYASKFAAINDPYADMSVGNVTGSNAVNVFLGIGIAWTIAAVYHATHDTGVFTVHAGSLAFSVTVFCILAFCAMIILLLRRHKSVGGELGGPQVPKYISGAIFMSFWLLYITLSTLESYCIIPGF